MIKRQGEAQKTKGCLLLSTSKRKKLITKPTVARPTYLHTQTPFSAPQPHCAPSSVAGPCIVCRDPSGGAAAATRTARLRGSRIAGCWSVGGCAEGGGEGGEGGEWRSIRYNKLAQMSGLSSHCRPNVTWHHLQGPELRHVVEAGHRQSADVVIVQGAEEKRGE